MRGDRGGRRRLFGVGVGVGVTVCAVLFSACGGGGGDSDPTVLRAGQMNIKLPAGYKVVDGKVERPAQAAASGGAGAATAQSGPTDTTLVATKQDPTTAMFTALSKFRACLEDTGTKFIGAPDQANPNSPTNDPTYVNNLSTCAARSQIVQALQASQGANDNLTPAEIETRNKGYLKWRTCMLDRGWKVPKPEPDSQGRLFSFSTSGSDRPQIEPPPGKDLLTSDDLQQCAAKAQPKN
jgi:hypothetical protein